MHESEVVAVYSAAAHAYIIAPAADPASEMSVLYQQLREFQYNN